MEEKREQQKIDIYCIARDVFYDLWVAILIAVSAAFLVYVGAKINYRPSYTSCTTFVVSAKGSSTGAYANLSKTNKMMDVFKSVMDSQVLKKKVTTKLKLDSFPGTVGIAVVPETNLLTMSVTSDSPEMSLRLLKNMLECYPEIGKNVLGEVVLEVFEEPGYPSVADRGFQGKEIMKKVFLVVFLAMSGLLAIISYLKDTVKNEREIPLKLDTAAIGVLYHEHRYKNIKSFLQRKKKKIFVKEPSVSFGYTETMKKIRTKLLYQMQKKDAKVILVTSTLAGEGKTTFAMNLAQVMSQRSRKVLLLEGNLRNPGLADCMRLDGEKLPSWGVYLKNDKNLREAFICPEGYGYQVMVNHIKISHSTDLLASDKMRKFMEEIRQEMDVVIIDAPQTRKRSDTEVLARLSDISVLIVKQNDALAKYINDSIDMLNDYGKGLAGCVFNDVTDGKQILSSGYGYGYGYRYGKYGRYGRFGKYGHYGYYSAHRNVSEKELKNE